MHSVQEASTVTARSLRFSWRYLSLSCCYSSIGVAFAVDDSRIGRPRSRARGPRDDSAHQGATAWGQRGSRRGGSGEGEPVRRAITASAGPGEGGTGEKVQAATGARGVTARRSALPAAAAGLDGRGEAISRGAPRPHGAV